MSISAPVGIGGTNLKADARIVQSLLNPHAGMLGVPMLVVDGICGVTGVEGAVLHVTRAN